MTSRPDRLSAEQLAGQMKGCWFGVDDFPYPRRAIASASLVAPGRQKTKKEWKQGSIYARGESIAVPESGDAVSMHPGRRGGVHMSHGHGMAIHEAFWTLHYAVCGHDALTVHSLSTLGAPMASAGVFFANATSLGAPVGGLEDESGQPMAARSSRG